MDLEKTLSSVRERLSDSLTRCKAGAILLSGGIDSGILSYLSPTMQAFAVSLEDEGEDLRYVSILAERLGLDLQVVKVRQQDALSALPDVVRILKSFDPALPNDLAVYFGMQEAKQQGFHAIMTGDGSDEFLGGYPYMQEMEDLDAYIRSMSRSFNFSSNTIGTYFGLEVRQPYLDADFVDFALTVPGELKIRKEQGQVWGKWCLRKAFEPFLPPEFIWQGKRPLEVGSGMTLLRQIIAERITDKELAEKQKQYGVKFLCKEHLYFYEIYRAEFGDVPPPEPDEDRCPGCGGGLPRGKRHCGICGAVI